MTSLLNALKALKSDILMVRPFRLLMKNGPVSYLLLAAITYFISLFFWPTPAVPLVCAVLLPAAIAAGLPPIVGAAAIAVAGQGMALMNDAPHLGGDVADPAHRQIIEPLEELGRMLFDPFRT